MIEALDRGVDAMIPESSMVKVYKAIDRAYREGRRDQAIQLHRQLLPILAFTNQEIRQSIAFFKRLLVRRGIFSQATMRAAPSPWDGFSERTADELIDHYLAVSNAC
jgi:4-hydroxy-tetrahydrodipicolinate synthase